MSKTAVRSLQRTPASAGLEPILEAMREDGGVIVEGMFGADTIAQMRAAADEFAQGIQPGGATQGLGDDGKRFVGANTIRFSSLARLTPAFFDVLDNELYAQIADAVLLPICGSYWLNTAQVMYIGPGETAQMLHRDANNWWAFVKATWPDSPEVTVSAMIGLEEVTEELGATRVVPGSHRQSELARYEERESVPAELGPGDALVYSGYVLHGGWRQPDNRPVAPGLPRQLRRRLVDARRGKPDGFQPGRARWPERASTTSARPQFLRPPPV